MKNSTFLFCVVLLGCVLSGKALSKNYNLSVDFRKDGENFIYSVKNISEKEIYLPNLYVGNPAETGFFLFIYDKRAKRARYADTVTHALSFPSGKISPHLPIKLMPGESFSAALDRRFILGWFPEFRPDECFLMMAKYRKNDALVMAESAVSRPVLVCNDIDYPGR